MFYLRMIELLEPTVFHMALSSSVELKDVTISIRKRGTID